MDLLGLWTAGGAGTRCRGNASAPATAPATWTRAGRLRCCKTAVSSTAKSGQRPGTPRSSCVPRSSKSRPDADDRAVDGPGDEQLAGLGQLRHARGDVHGHAADVVAEQLALARCAGRPARSSPSALDGRARSPAAQRTACDGAPANDDEERVADRLDLAAAEAVDLAADDRVVGHEQVAPAGVAEPGGVAGRADDVGEQDRQQRALRSCRAGRR